MLGTNFIVAYKGRSMFYIILFSSIVILTVFPCIVNPTLEIMDPWWQRVIKLGIVKRLLSLGYERSTGH